MTNTTARTRRATIRTTLTGITRLLRAALRLISAGAFIMIRISTLLAATLTVTRFSIMRLDILLSHLREAIRKLPSMFHHIPNLHNTLLTNLRIPKIHSTLLVNLYNHILTIMRHKLRSLNLRAPDHQL